MRPLDSRFDAEFINSALTWQPASNAASSVFEALSHFAHRDRYGCEDIECEPDRLRKELECAPDGAIAAAARFFGVRIVVLQLTDFHGIFAQRFEPCEGTQATDVWFLRSIGDVHYRWVDLRRFGRPFM